MQEPMADLFRWTATIWADAFVPPLPIIEKIIRAVLVYIALVVLLRLFGKRELAQLNPFDLVVLLTLSNTVQNAIIGNDNSLTGGIVGAVALLAMNYLVVRFLFRHRRLDQILEGEPTVLIDNGQVMHKALAKELLTESELVTVVRRQGYESVREVQSCILEPGGFFFLQGRHPRTEELRHQQVIALLEKISRQVQSARE